MALIIKTHIHAYTSTQLYNVFAFVYLCEDIEGNLKQLARDKRF